VFVVALAAVDGLDAKGDGVGERGTGEGEGDGDGLGEGEGDGEDEEGGDEGAGEISNRGFNDSYRMNSFFSFFSFFLPFPAFLFDAALLSLESFDAEEEADADDDEMSMLPNALPATIDANTFLSGVKLEVDALLFTALTNSPLRLR